MAGSASCESCNWPSDRPNKGVNKIDDDFNVGNPGCHKQLPNLGMVNDGKRPIRMVITPGWFMAFGFH